MKTVVGLVESFSQANRAVDELLDEGFNREGIGLVSREEAGQYGAEPAVEGESGRESDKPLKSAASRVTGFSEGLSKGTIPGIGSVVAAGSLASAAAGAETAAGGFVARLLRLGVPEDHAHSYAEGVRRGGTLLTVTCDDTRAKDAADILNRHGAIDIGSRAAEWKRAGWTRFDERAAPLRSGAPPQERAAGGIPRERKGVLPVVEEDIRVGKRKVDTGAVHVESHVSEHPVEEDVVLREQRAKVERRTVDRPLSAAESEEAFRETSVDIPESREEAVVSKQARVKEEIVLGREEKERTETIRETVRRTDVDVQAGARQGVGDEGFLEPDDADFRQHFQTYYAQRGEDYRGFRDAYRYGATMSQHTRKDWQEVEEDIHRDWDKDHPGTWGKFKEAIHYGWDKTHRH